MVEATEHRSISEADSLTHAVVAAVAEEKNVPAETVAGRIYDVIDPDGLNRIFEPAGPDTPRQNARLAFEVAGCDVVIEGGELIMVTPAQSSPSRFEDEQ